MVRFYVQHLVAEIIISGGVRLLDAKIYFYDIDS